MRLRPLSCLCPTSKIFERLMITGINTGIMLFDSQYGFRTPQKSTTKALFSLLHSISSEFNKKLPLQTARWRCLCIYPKLMTLWATPPFSHSSITPQFSLIRSNACLNTFDIAYHPPSKIINNPKVSSSIQEFYRNSTFYILLYFSTFFAYSQLCTFYAADFTASFYDPKVETSLASFAGQCMGNLLAGKGSGIKGICPEINGHPL